MIQEKTARTPHTLRVAGGCRKYVGLHARSHGVRTHVHTRGRAILSSFDVFAVCTAVRQRKHSTAQRHRKNNENETEKNWEEKTVPVPS